MFIGTGTVPKPRGAYSFECIVIPLENRAHAGLWCGDRSVRRGVCTLADRVADGTILSATRSPASGVIERLDRLSLTRLHLLIVLVCAGGFCFDVAEIAIGSALSAVFSAPPNPVAPGQLAWLLSAMYIGGIVGAPAMGWVADRHGRKLVLSGVLLFLAVVSVAAAFSRDIQSLIVLRGISGIALGAFPPLMISYLTDILPPRRRGTMIFLTSAVAALGPIAIIFVIRWFTPLHPLGLDAWRWAFILGSCGAGLFGLLFLLLPESPRWLFARGRLDEAETIVQRFEASSKIDWATENAASTELRSQPGNAPQKTNGNASLPARIALVASLYFLSPWATVAFPLLTGVILVAKGFQLSDTLLYVGVATFGPLLGQVIAAGFIDHLERRFALAPSAAVMALSGVLFALSLSPIWLMVSGIVFTISAQLYVPTLNLYAAELFPTKLRARATSGAWAANRVGSAIAPLVLLPLLHLGGPMALFAVILAALALSIVIVLAFAPNGRAGRAVE